jgi:hypothetical protein
VTTDLTGDFELDEDELEWDVFVPDPDDAEIAAEAAALEDEDELDLDDSDFDWDSALREDPELEGDAESGARAGAAYDRIVDTVRRSFEEPELEREPEREREPEADAEPVTVLAVETAAATEPEPAAEELAAAYAEREPQADLYRLADLELAEELEEPAWTREPDATAPVPETAVEPEPEAEPEALFVTATNAGPETAVEPEPDADGEPDGKPALEFEPAEARIATLAAAIAAAAPVAPPPIESSEPEPDLASEPAAQWEEAGETTPAQSLAPRRTRMSQARNQRVQNERSRVFTATIVLACLVLVVIAAAAFVYALHHPNAGPTTANAPAHAAASASPSSDTARIQAATDALDSATTSASVALSSLATFPTPSNVEKIINSYISSLQLYGTLLSGSTVPAPARSDVSSAEAQVRQELQFLDTIDSLPPLQLGAFLKQFDIDATQLQTTLSALEQNLRATTS